MTVSSSFSYSPSCDAILTQAAHIAGIIPLGRTLAQQADGAAKLAQGREMLNSYLKHGSAMGASLTQLEDATLAVVAGTGSYVLAADTIDVDFPMKLIASGQTQETWIDRFTWEEYQEQSDHTIRAVPYACYPERQASVTLKLHPLPDAAYTLRYRRQRLVRDMTGSTTLDNRQTFFEALVYAMAHKFALGGNINMTKVKYLGDMADDREKRAHGRENEGGDLQFHLECC